MPALHLLVMAVELVMKADLMRSEKDPGNVHSLDRLYKALDSTHRKEAESRFARCKPNSRLQSVGETPPTIADMLAIYDQSYGGASKVYMDTRYYAEPTTKFSKSTGLHGTSLFKSNTPYPIFFPLVVKSLIEAFRFFDGAERLKRLGAEVALGAKAAVKNNHGEWGLVPGSLGLVVVQVPPKAWKDSGGEGELPDFKRWRHLRPPGYSTSWMYGGNKLLFYRADKNTPSDSEQNIDGIDGRLWRDESLGMNPRDLYGLADVLESGEMTNTLQM